MLPGARIYQWCQVSALPVAAEAASLIEKESSSGPKKLQNVTLGDGSCGSGF